MELPPDLTIFVRDACPCFQSEQRMSWTSEDGTTSHNLFIIHQCQITLSLMIIETPETARQCVIFLCTHDRLPISRTSLLSAVPSGVGVEDIAPSVDCHRIKRQTMLPTCNATPAFQSTPRPPPRYTECSSLCTSLRESLVYPIFDPEIIDDPPSSPCSLGSRTCSPHCVSTTDRQT